MVQPRINSLRARKNPKKIINDPLFWVFTKKEIIWALVFIIIASFISFVPLVPNDNPLKILTTLLIFTIIITINLAAKKITSKHYSIKIEHKIWELKIWGFRQRYHFKKPFPVGLIAPFFLSIFTIGYLKPFTFFQFDAEDIPSRRLLKSQGQKRAQRKETINEEDLGYTAASGFLSLLVLAAIALILKQFIFEEFFSDLIKYSIYFGIWNLLPIGQLDGSKLFFSTTVLWTFLLIIYLVSFLFIII